MAPDTDHRQLGRVDSISTRRLRRPLRPAWGPGVDWLDLVIITVRTTEDFVGTGFAWTPGVIAGAIESIVRYDLTPVALGESVDATVVWERLSDHCGTMRDEGPVTMAIGAVDMALWDLKARALDIPVAEMIGARHASVAVYRSGINFYAEPRDIFGQASRWASTGATAIKIKVGRPDLGADVDVVRRVREIIGPTCELMIDANQRWETDQAIRAMEQLSSFDLRWVEEPLRNSTAESLERLRGCCPVPIALGENLYTVQAFEDVAALGLVDIVQPNISRVGGITPFLRIAQIAEGAQQRLIPHLLPEISGQLALTLHDESMVEIADGYTFSDLDLIDGSPPMREENQRLESTDRPGLGMTFTPGEAPNQKDRHP